MRTSRGLLVATVLGLAWAVLPAGASAQLSSIDLCSSADPVDVSCVDNSGYVISRVVSLGAGNTMQFRVKEVEGCAIGCDLKIDFSDGTQMYFWDVPPGDWSPFASTTPTNLQINCYCESSEPL